MDKVLWSSTSGEWGTPRDLFDRLNAVYRFDYDPAATHDNHLANRYSTLEGTFRASPLGFDVYRISDMNGLDYSWEGQHVFLNPPYGRGIESWMKKAATEPLLCVALLPVRTGSRWWQEWVMPYADIEFLPGRLKFVGAENSAPFDSAIARYRG